MSFVEKVYRKMPVPLQSVMITVRGAQLVRQRYGRAYRQHKAALPALLTQPYERLRDYQLRELRELIGYAKARSPYYARTLRDIDPDSIRSVEDLERLPVLEKEELRAHCEEIYTVPGREAIEAHTGGTTGKSLIVRYTRRDFQHRMAELDFFRETHGARHGMRRASFSGKHVVQEENPRVFWRTNRVLNQRFYSTFHLAPENLQRYIDDLNAFQPQVIDGYTSCIVDLCQYVLSSGQRFAFAPVAIFPTSETLYPHRREILRQALGVEPRDQYASAEGAPLITECSRGELHYQIQTGVIEADAEGEALVTSFSTHGTPLIRYRVGDRVLFKEGRCSCGWNTPLVEGIEGRNIDYLISPTRGRIYASNIVSAVKDLPNSVIQTQFVQHSPTHVQVNVVVDPGRFGEGQKAIIVAEVKRRLGAEMGVEVVTVPVIERAASGKQRFIVNELV
ncbi:phenylacetate--CoA ligase family protein [soil metagenome]